MVEARVAWIALGANLGRRGEGLAAARRELLEDGTLLVTGESPVLWTRAVGVVEQPPFHNQVLRLEASTALADLAWLRRCQDAEGRAGRRATYRWGPRRADCDLLLLGEKGEVRSVSERLVVPHPELANRPFLCAQVAAIEPGLRHPDGWLFADRAGIWRGLRSPRRNA